MKTPLLFFAIVAIFSGCKTNVETIEIDGLAIPISTCVKANKYVVQSHVKVKEFCHCILPEMYEQVKQDSTKLERFKKDGYDFQSASAVLQSHFEACAKSALKGRVNNLRLTPATYAYMKTAMKNQLEGTDFEKDYDVDAYCNCMIRELPRYFSAYELLLTYYHGTEKYRTLRDNCALSSRKK